MGLKDKLTKIGAVDIKEDLYEIKEYINTGNYLLNAIISGDIDKGIPCGRIIQLAGEESTGKTYLTLEILKNAQQQGYTIIYFDSEFAINKKDLELRGLDLDKFVIIPVKSVEDFRNKLTSLLDEYDPNEDGKIILALDSLGNLYTEKEYNDAITGADKADLTRARLLKSLFRIATINCGIKQIPFIVINHVYAGLNSFVKQNVIAGGFGSKYAASVILELTKAQDKESNGRVIGSIITVKSIKNRLAKEKTKVKININFDKGLDPYSGLLNFAIELGIIKDLGRKRIEFNEEKYSVKNLNEKFWNKIFNETNFKKQLHKYFSYVGVYLDNETNFNSNGESETEI